MKFIQTLADANFRLFRSLNLTLVLLIVIGLGAAVGSFFPQLPQNPNLSLEDLQPHYASWAWAVLRFFQVFDLFHSWWFSLALVLLMLNLLACSAPRLPGLKKALRHRLDAAPPGAQALTLPAGAPASPEKLRPWLAGKLGISQRQLQPMEKGLRYERGRWGRPGFLLVHFGLVLLLLAGAWSQLLGRDGTLVLEPGQRSGSLLVSSSDGRMASERLPFEIGCTDFFMERYGAGARTVRDYVSLLQIHEDGEVKLSRRVEVNQPLAYGGYHFYQTAYQRVPGLDRATLLIEDAKVARRVEVGEGEALGVDAQGVRYSLLALREDFKTWGPAVQVGEFFPDGRRRSFWVLERYPGLVERHRPGGMKLDLKKVKAGYATVLSVARDPATPGIWAGSVVLMLGLLLTFGLRHRALWLIQDEKGVRLQLWAHRGQTAWVARVKEALAEGEGSA